jgi:Kef-type K+ transport system membrane component KefB
MKKVVIYSALLLSGLIGSQWLPSVFPELFSALVTPIKLMTMFCLAFIMIHVGLEFEIDKSNLRQYGWDYVVAATAAAFPWILCALYFVFVMTPSDGWFNFDAWKESLLVSRFSAPTSAGVLFSMLAAAGLASTWVFKKARILAIFDDLDTILLMIPLKILMVGLKWQLGIIVLVIVVLLYLAWKYLHTFKLPTSWGWILFYSAIITVGCELIYLSSKMVDELVPIHLEVLLPAFVMGCVLAHGHAAHNPKTEERISNGMTGLFMVLVGLAMPLIVAGSSGTSSSSTMSLIGGAWPGWGVIITHVLVITVISNIGKMFSLLCYRREASVKERLALSIAMFPRGEVGAGVLVISLSYGIGGPVVTVALLSLALNLVMTGFFIAMVKRLVTNPQPACAHEAENRCLRP